MTTKTRIKRLLHHLKLCLILAAWPFFAALSRV